jgi:hypothetical protein
MFQMIIDLQNTHKFIHLSPAFQEEYNFVVEFLMNYLNQLAPIIKQTSIYFTSYKVALRIHTRKKYKDWFNMHSKYIMPISIQSEYITPIIYNKNYSISNLTPYNMMLKKNVEYYHPFFQIRTNYFLIEEMVRIDRVYLLTEKVFNINLRTYIYIHAIVKNTSPLIETVFDLCQYMILRHPVTRDQIQYMYDRNSTQLKSMLDEFCKNNHIQTGSTVDVLLDIANNTSDDTLSDRIGIMINLQCTGIRRMIRTIV